MSIVQKKYKYKEHIRYILYTTNKNILLQEYKRNVGTKICTMKVHQYLINKILFCNYRIAAL